MNISGLQYSLNQKTLEIYLSGCLGCCPDCHNPELWDFSQGSDFRKWLPKIERRIQSGLVDHIWILGGDPMDQSEEDLVFFLGWLDSIFGGRPIWLWTRKDYPSQIPDSIVKYLSYIKTGPFLKDDSSYVCPITGITLASSNQKIIQICQHQN